MRSVSGETSGIRIIASVLGGKRKSPGSSLHDMSVVNSSIRTV